MPTKTIEIVDHGRGLQLSTSRVTVQDLVPYFQEGCTSDEIIRWIPTLHFLTKHTVEQASRADYAEPAIPARNYLRV